MKLFLKTVMFLNFLILICCKGNIKNFNTIFDEEINDSIITVNEFPDKEVILTQEGYENLEK